MSIPEGPPVNVPGPDEAEDATLRQRMLDAGLRLVEAAGGLTVSLEHLSLESVIKEAGVSRTSVYREWESKDAFNVDLLCALAGPGWQGTAAFDERTIQLARDVVAERLAELHHVDRRRLVAEEAIRLATRRNFEFIATSAQWRTYVALTATLLTMSPESPDRARIQEALRASESVFIGRMADFYSDMAILLGFRLKSYVPSFHVFAALSASLVEGLSLRHILAPELVDTPLAPPAGDANVEWHVSAAGFLALFREMMEEDPDYVFSTAITTYLKRLSDREAVLNAETTKRTSSQ
jgi:AcrR family transcriptional regulator